VSGMQKEKGGLENGTCGVRRECPDERFRGRWRKESGSNREREDGRGVAEEGSSGRGREEERGKGRGREVVGMRTPRSHAHCGEDRE